MFAMSTVVTESLTDTYMLTQFLFDHFNVDVPLPQKQKKVLGKILMINVSKFVAKKELYCFWAYTKFSLSLKF